MKMVKLCLLATIGFSGMLRGQETLVEPDTPAYEPEPTLPPAEFNVVGASAMKKTMEVWTAAFTNMYPQVRFRLTHKGSSTAAAPLVTDLSQIAPMGRELWDCELFQFRFTWGFLPAEIVVSRGSYNIPSRSQILAVYVNKDNPIRRLTLAQLDAVYSHTRRRHYSHDVTTWGQLGATGAWASRPINIYGLTGDSTGVSEWFRDRVLLKGKYRDSVEEQTSAQEMMKHVGEDRDGIGFTGISYLTPQTKVVPLAETAAGPYSAGSLADVLAGRYPLTRSMYIYIKKTPGKPLDPTLREFLLFILSREGQQTAITGGELLPLPAAAVREQRAKIEHLE
jgi:phosphate transport system substrate-binding protein